MDNIELRMRIKIHLIKMGKTLKWLAVDLYPPSEIEAKYGTLRKVMSMKGNMDLYPKVKTTLKQWLENRDNLKGKGEYYE